MKEGWIVCAKKVVYGSALVFLAFLSIVSFLYSSDGYELEINGVWGIARDALGCILFFGLCWFLAYFVGKRSKWFCTTGCILIFFTVMFFSIWWIVNSANLPQSDAKSVYDIACRARDHDLLPIAPTGSYMSLWPFQSGLVLFFEVILRLIPEANEMTIQWFYLPFMALSLVSGYMVMKRIFPSARTRIFWCLLMLFCFPYYFHINNMYGEIPSIALSLFALWMLLENTAKPSWYKLLFAGIGLAAAVAIRKNTLIFVIAYALAWAAIWLAKRQRRCLVMILVLIAAAAAGVILPSKFYEYRAKNTMGEGVPAMAYIAMGMQWSEERSPGAWNGYHANLFMECSYDAEETARISAEAVKTSLKYMMGHPDYLVKFYYHKQVEQWEREDYHCLYSTLAFYNGRTPAAWEIYEGEVKDKLMSFMSVHQSLVYLGAGCFCILGAIRWRKGRESCKDRTDSNNVIEVGKLSLLATFIGGFLFSMMWEANPRYNMPYFVMLIPYAADGLASISYCLENLPGSRKHSKT